jgi:hypothetical protein
VADLSGFLAIGLRLLSARILAILALLMTFGLFSWAMWMQTTLACIIASIFGGVIFLPVLFSGTRGGHGENE